MHLNPLHQARIKPAPQRHSKLLQTQCRILNWLHHSRNSWVFSLKGNHSFFSPFFFFSYRCSSLDWRSSLLFLVNRIFITNNLLNFEKCFSASVEIGLLFFYIFLLVCQIVLLFLRVTPTLNFWDKPHIICSTHYISLGLFCLCLVNFLISWEFLPLSRSLVFVQC